jgi:carbon-monoxide dehydrogenase large subunit
VNDKPDTSAFTRPNSYVGRTLSRAGAKRAVAGRGRYTDDVSLPRMLHAAFVRSPFAHARITSIDTSEARRQPGVALVMTGAELARLCTAPWVGTLTCFPGMKSAPQFPMAVDRACWAGEPVAMVVAGTRAEAEDAAERVRIEWQELPVVADKKTALAAGSPVIHAGLGDNLAFRKVIDTGSVDAAFAKAYLVIEETFEFGRHTAVSLESRAVLAQYDKGTGKLTITTSSQCPHMIQRVFAQTLGVPDHRVQIIAPDVGGSFGLKIHTYGDEVATAAAAIQLGPTRQVHRRPARVVRVRHPCTRELRESAHRLLPSRGRSTPSTSTCCRVPVPTRSIRAPACSREPRCSTSRAGPTGTSTIAGAPAWPISTSRRRRQYRAVGHPIGNTVGEHLVDRAAAALGIDAIEMRRRNVFPDDGYPATTASGVKLKDLSHQRCIDTLVERMRYFELRAEQARLRKQGIHRGIGIACFIKGTAPGPHGYYGMGGAPISLQDACVIRLEPNGGVICSVGVTEQGQGTDTVMGQIAAAALGVPFESVRVISGDTDAIPYGGGTFGSRAAAIGGEAVYQAARDLRQEILQIAGVLLQGRRIRTRHRRRDGGRSRRRGQAAAARRDRPHWSLPAGRAAEGHATRAFAHAALPSG